MLKEAVSRSSLVSQLPHSETFKPSKTCHIFREKYARFWDGLNFHNRQKLTFLAIFEEITGKNEIAVVSEIFGRSVSD